MENIQDYINQSAKQKLWNDLNELSKIAKSCSLLDGVYAKVDGVMGCYQLRN